MQLTHLPFSLPRFARLADHLSQPVRNALAALRLFRSGAKDGLDLMQRYEALNRLSDSELARRGLRRDEIGQMTLEDSTPPGRRTFR